MKIKLYLIFLTGLIIGGAFMYCLQPFHSYFKTSNHVVHGRELLSFIKKYEEAHGSPPSQAWFYSLDHNLTTLEGRQWIYLERPIHTHYRGGLRIIAPVDYRRSYLGGFQDGVVISTDPHRISSSEKIEP